MKSSLAVSLAIHTGLTLILWIGVHLNSNVEARPVIYRVNLVEPPPVVETPAPAPEPEPEPEPLPSPPQPVPQEVPAIRVRDRRARDAELRPPEAAAPQPIRLDEPERRRREETVTPEPEPAPVVATPEPTPPQEERPRGKSTEVVTDVPAFTEFAYYRVAMRNKISALWSPPGASTELSCSVRFRIVRSGVIVGARVERSSGLSFFDHTALRAVVEASPLPPLPADFPTDVVGVTFQFAYKP